MSDTTFTAPKGPFVALLLLSVAFAAWVVFQSVQLLSERNTLEALRTAQAQSLSQSQKLRGELDSIASNTQRLAESGNASARLIVDELRKRGITINPDAQSSPPPR